MWICIGQQVYKLVDVNKQTTKSVQSLHSIYTALQQGGSIKKQ